MHLKATDTTFQNMGCTQPKTFAWETHMKNPLDHSLVMSSTSPAFPNSMLVTKGGKFSPPSMGC